MDYVLDSLVCFKNSVITREEDGEIEIIIIKQNILFIPLKLSPF